MNANVIRTIRNAVLTAALLAYSFLAVGCTTGNALDSVPDAGAATSSWQTAECVKAAGSDIKGAMECVGLDN